MDICQVDILKKVLEKVPCVIYISLYCLSYFLLTFKIGLMLKKSFQMNKIVPVLLIENSNNF